MQEEVSTGLVKGEEVIELVPAHNGSFRLPTSIASKAEGIEVQRAIGKFHEHHSEREQVEALSNHVHYHLPTCPGCPGCLHVNLHTGYLLECPGNLY